MNEEVKATEEQEIPVIKYTNSKGEEVDIPEADLNEEEGKLVTDIKNVTASDPGHRQCTSWKHGEAIIDYESEPFDRSITERAC